MMLVLGKILDTVVPGLCLFLLVSVPQLEATIAIAVGGLALTAPQVTGLVALKALALAGFGKGMTKKKTANDNLMWTTVFMKDF